MEKIGLLFPGQGSQDVGMARNLYDSLDEAACLLNYACDILDFDLKKLLFEGPIEKLTMTEYAQPAIFTVSMMYLKKLLSQGVQYHIVAGHSLGEYSALCAAGVFSFEDGLNMVRKRGVAMSNQNGSGTMFAILGMDEREVEEAIKDFENVVIANINSQNQIVISGENKSLQEAINKLSTVDDIKIKQLNVSGAFHSPMMTEASDIMKNVIDKIKFKDASIKIIPNTLGTPTQNSTQIKECLKKQMTGQVKWLNTILSMKQYEVDLLYEVGYGDILKKLNKTICFRPKCIGV